MYKAFSLPEAGASSILGSMFQNSIGKPIKVMLINLPVTGEVRKLGHVNYFEAIVESHWSMVSQSPLVNAKM